MIRIIIVEADNTAEIKIRQLFKDLGTYLAGKMEKWEIRFYDATTKQDRWKYVGSTDGRVYVYGGNLSSFVCDARGVKVSPQDRKAHLSISLEEWHNILERKIEHIEFIAKDVRHVFVIPVERAKAEGHEYNTMNGARWLVPLDSYDECGTHWRIIKPHTPKPTQSALF